MTDNAGVAGQDAATEPGQAMRKAQAVGVILAPTWAFMVSRLSESNRRPIHFERPRALVGIDR